LRGSQRSIITTDISFRRLMMMISLGFFQSAVDRGEKQPKTDATPGKLTGRDGAQLTALEACPFG
jgi:hypothetical protein